MTFKMIHFKCCATLFYKERYCPLQISYPSIQFPKISILIKESFKISDKPMP